ncbi:MAG: LysR family transcriptional regulator [Lachnospiraceae bacterium]|nr:LysR family transcriptional regulator [Lachnospiraceae bacterium]
MLGYKLKITLGDEEKVFGPGVASLMEKVEECGSLASACREMHMAYSKGWRIIRRAENGVGFPLMQGVKGGKQGGSTVLTQEGKELLLKFRQLEERMNEQLDLISLEIFGQQ